MDGSYNNHGVDNPAAEHNHEVKNTGKAEQYQSGQEGDDEHYDDDEISITPELLKPPDGGYGWVIVLASFVCNVVVDGIGYTFGIFMNDMALEYGEGKGRVAWVGSLLAGMYLSVGPIVSAMTNKYGCRAVCIGGSIVAAAAFALSQFSPSVNVLMIIYGFFGGIGFGFIYLPAVVCVGYYFEKKRSLATGIAVCGSGFGTVVFPPLANVLLKNFGWKQANLLLAGVILICGVGFGALMKPLELVVDNKTKPLLQRMAEEKRNQMKRGSIAGSYFMVQLPDGSMEKRMKMPINVDPGVHSSLHLDQLSQAQANMMTSMNLPTITETKMGENGGGDENDNDNLLDSGKGANGTKYNERPDEFNVRQNIPRNASQPAFATHDSRIPKNGSVPSFDRMRRTSLNERYRPTLQPIRSKSKSTLEDGEIESMMGVSKASLHKSNKELVRPLSRKDIFYSGSIANLQSQRSLTGRRKSVVSLARSNTQPQIGKDDGDAPADLCSCFKLPESFKSVFNSMMDVSLLKDHAFMLIGISNLFGMAALYVPFVYLVNAAVIKQVDENSASFLISIIGITNTVGRIAVGWLADFPQVDALLFNNVCLVIGAVAVAATPLCESYGAFVAVAIFFGIAICGYISLTSIILVDLLGLEKLTNAFGLLLLFRGVAATFGSPLAGAVYDATESFTIPFLMGGAFFAISAAASFLAPVMKRRQSEKVPQIIQDTLSPISEDEEEEDGSSKKKVKQIETSV